MKFTLSWLRRHLDTGAGLAEIANRLTALGLEVEEIVDRSEILAPFKVAAVVEASPHPNADKLTVCVVDIGGGRQQVVCGAPNARAGIKGVFAAPGQVVPGTGAKLKRAEIRGVESAGMLCSEQEMGLGDSQDGIIELPSDASVGEPFAAVLGLDDPVVDVAITPDRGDCLGVRGIARDLAASGLGKLRPLDETPVAGTFPAPIGVHLEFDAAHADACPHFIGRYIRGVTNGPSPRWLRDRLISVGLRPISALVDITNWLALDLGRPAHVFDADNLRGDLRVRLSHAGEGFAALNDRVLETDDAMTAVCDDRGLIALGGVIGGAETGCTDSTTNVFLEIAYFDPVRTAATGRAVGVESDARYRFERGVDPAFLPAATEIASRLIMELCGGEASHTVNVGSALARRPEVSFRPGRVATLGGAEVAAKECRNILEGLGCSVSAEGETWQVGVPTWRSDIEVEADLVEEVLRINGYGGIPAVSLPRPAAVARPVLALSQRRVSWCKRALAARGLVEAVTWSFVSDDHARFFGGGGDSLRLDNPISAELTAMRPSLLPNLIAAAGRNADRGMVGDALFETGQIFADDTAEGQRLAAAGVRWGSYGPGHWLSPERDVDAFDVKADAEAVIGACNLPVQRLRVTADAPDWYHPGRSGVLHLGPTALAHFGELHPRTLESMGVKGPIAGFEVFLYSLPAKGKEAAKGKSRPALRLSPYQAVNRDFAFVVDADVAGVELVAAVRNADKSLIDDVTVFDLYEGVGEGRKSIAVSVRLQPLHTTLTESQIDDVSVRIRTAVKKATDGVLRN